MSVLLVIIGALLVWFALSFMGALIFGAFIRMCNVRDRERIEQERQERI